LTRKVSIRKTQVDSFRPVIFNDCPSLADHPLEINLFSITLAGIETGQATLGQISEDSGYGLPVAWFFVTASNNMEFAILKWYSFSP